MSEETKKVYLITSGEYSDYGIDMICDTKETAEKEVELAEKGHNGSRYNIEEWEINTRKAKDVVINWIFWYDLDKNEFIRLERTGLHEFSNYLKKSNRLGGTVRAADEEKAKKIIYDMVAKKKAELAEIT
ncbi:MAG TPA: hypothetical protein VMV86_04430 [Methanosarcinales archaeon]|nr:hypothetical protein [Methanosarcinales archaeon]